jgi:hypothetical protein
MKMVYSWINFMFEIETFKENYYENNIMLLIILLFYIYIFKKYVNNLFYESP